MKNLVTFCFCLAILLVAGSLSWFVIHQDGVINLAIAREGDALRKLVKTEVDGQVMLRVDRALAIMDTRSGEALRQVSAARTATDQQIKTLNSTVRQSLVSANTSIARIADSTAVFTSAEADIRPAIAQTTETLESIDKGVKLLTPQLLGLTAATKVTMGETAQTMRLVRDQAPRALTAAIDLEEHADAIAGDVQRIADKVVKPKTKKERILGFFEIAAGIAVAHIL